MSTHPLRPALLPSLNALLVALALPFTLDHPTDLTPSLLLAIFESLISARLPIPLSVRQSRTREAKSRAMLVLLGVLECDVLRGGTTSTDAGTEHSLAASNASDSVLGGAGGVSVDGWVDEIGLGEVDPERLADGGWEETIFVGELLCWLARRRGVLPRIRSSNRSSHPRSLYSSYHSYGTEDDDEGDIADFSTSLLLQPSSAQKLRSPRPPSPSPSIDPDAEADFSALSHITDVPRHPLVHSPEPSLSASATTGTDLSIRARSVSSRTSVSNARDDLDEFEEASQDTLQMYDPLRMMRDAEDDDDLPPTFRPRCIHELEDPSYIRALAGPSLSFDASVSHEHVSEDEDDPSKDQDGDVDQQDNDDPYAPSTPTPTRVRLTGWIDPVDAATELGHFAASRFHPHSRSPAFSTSVGSNSGPPSQSHRRKPTHTGELPMPTSCLNTEISSRSRPGMGKSRIPHRASPPSSPSPPPSSPTPASSEHPHPRFPSSHPPSPPSPTYSDPSFDIFFSDLNNTSTPAKPRPQWRPHLQTMTHHDIEAETQVRVDTGTATCTGTGRPRPRRERSPSYTPSPPSFSTPGSLRNAGASGMSTGTRLDSTGSSGAKTRFGASASDTMPAPSSTTTRRQKSVYPPLLPSNTIGKLSPAIAPASSTATTNTLLTERARLLTELATLKRVHAASGAGTSRAGGVVNHRVGVGV